MQLEAAVCPETLNSGDLLMPQLTLELLRRELMSVLATVCLVEDGLKANNSIVMTEIADSVGRCLEALDDLTG